jgi:hypothetical protein
LIFAQSVEQYETTRRYIKQSVILKMYTCLSYRQHLWSRKITKILRLDQSATERVVVNKTLFKTRIYFHIALFHHYIGFPKIHFPIENMKDSLTEIVKSYMTLIWENKRYSHFSFLWLTFLIWWKVECTDWGDTILILRFWMVLLWRRIK